MKLCNANLSQLSADVKRPDYARSGLSAGIVHIGLGNFHRAHQAWYLHRLMQDGKAHDWAIVGAGVRPNDSIMRDKLAAQDYLTTLVELDPARTAAEVTGSMIDFLPVEENNASLIAKMADPAIRIVSLTVTEGGYYRDAATGEFDADHPDIQHDVANPETPITAFGAMIAALKLRKQAGERPFTAQSCDNLLGNGTILRDTIVLLAQHTDLALADWIDTNGAFPNSMVDCIVPATGPKEIEQAAALGVDDAAPVTHESFRQWVIEDNFCAGRPPWEDAGATMTDSVHSFEAMKLRLLNAGHQLLANAGELLGCVTIAECMENDQIAGFFKKVLSDEVAQHVDAVPGMSPASYIDLIAGRFANPLIHDTTRRVAFDGSSRQTGFLLPTVRDVLASASAHDGLALSQALWARMCAGTREDGSAIEANDPFWDDLHACALQAKETPKAWLDQSQYYGEIGQHSGFAVSFSNWLNIIWDQGSAAALAAYLEK